MNKRIQILIISISSILTNSGNCFCQTDPKRAYKDSIEQILRNEHRVFRIYLDAIDSMELTITDQKISYTTNKSDLLVDSLISVIKLTSTPAVLAKEISHKILEIGTDYSIQALLNNLNLTKPNYVGSASWDQNTFPCLIALLDPNIKFQVYDKILNSDFLENYDIINLPFDKTSISFISRFFLEYPPSREIISYQMRLPNNSEKYNSRLEQILKDIQ
jgi:hypothetical protein